MKRFLHKKWLSIPVIVVLVLALAAGSAFAAYSFLGFTTAISVDEPLAVEYNLQGNYGGDSEWHLLPDQDSMTIEGSAGDDFNIDLRINNRANNPLTADTVITGNTGYVICTGFPGGGFENVAASDNVDTNSPEWGPHTANIKIKGDAPVGTLSVTFTFTRE